MIIWASQDGWSIELPAEPLAQLKSDEFRKREKGQADLLAWARENSGLATDELLLQSKVADDPEVRDRCLAVLRDLVNDEYLKEGEGYIGIRMMDEFANIPGDPKRRGVIRVIQVVPDSAAQHAGLQLNDLITAVDDLVWHEGVASLSFTEKVRQLKPNTKVMLKVLRDGKLMDIEVKLGRRPLFADNLFFDERQMDPEAAEKKAKDAYFHRWIERKKLQK